MQTRSDGSLDLTNKRTVAFTLFPGLEVSTPNLHNGQPEPVYKAVVKLYEATASRVSSTAQSGNTTNRAVRAVPDAALREVSHKSGHGTNHASTLWFDTYRRMG
jgi:hypothetical protein